MHRYLVTGGAGFIGSNLVGALLARGHHVHVLDNFSTGKRANLERYHSYLQTLPGHLEIFEGDLRDYHIVQNAVQSVEFILHQAALPSVPRSVRDPISSNQVNVVGTLNLLYAAHKAGVKRLVYASSSSVYGNNLALPKHESMCPMPKSPYAVSKLAAEQYCQVFYEIYGLETVCLRYFNVFGPHQDPQSLYAAVIPKFIVAALQGETIQIHGDGQQSRDFTHISNVVQANLLAFEAANAAGQAINISCGNRHSLLDLIHEIETYTQKSLNRQHLEPRVGDVQHSQADISKARRLLNYEPLISFQEGLRQTIEWYQKESV